MSRAADDTSKVSFFYGAGIAGVLAGAGIISPRSAVLLGIGSLLYAHSLKPIVNVTARPELTDTLPQAPSLPSFPELPFGLGAMGCGSSCECGPCRGR